MNVEDAPQRWLSEADSLFSPSLAAARTGTAESWELPPAAESFEFLDLVAPAEAGIYGTETFERYPPEAGEWTGEDSTSPGFAEAGTYGTETFERYPPEAGEWTGEDSTSAAFAEAWPTEALPEPHEHMHEDMIAELLAEDAVVTSLPAGPQGQFDEEPTPERFTGTEHRAIGHLGSGGASSVIRYGSPPKQLTFGEVVALAGDYFGDYGELYALNLTDAGRRQLAWARWDCLSGPGFTEPEPPVDAAVKRAVVDRYYQLASENFSHFLEPGGTARRTYTTWHASAIAAALEAGLSRDRHQWLIALTREAFADHFLTDSFSGGHIRTPRTQIKMWYGAEFAGAEPFVRYMARFMYRQLDAQGRLNWLLNLLEGMTRATIERKIRKLGGEALATFSLGDIVSKALHDYDNAHGVKVVSDLDPNGNAPRGGHRWTALGDSHLYKHGPQTQKMAVAAVRASIRDLSKVRDAAARVGNRQLAPSQRIQLVRQALGTPTFEALRYLPREVAGHPQNPALFSTGGVRAPLDWRWGQLGPLAYQAVHGVVGGDIADNLAKKTPVIDDSTTRFGITVTGIRGAFAAFVQHLRQHGIAAIEAAVGRKAR